MISQYLKSKQIINLVQPTVNENELNLDTSERFYYLKCSDYSSGHYYYRNLFTDFELNRIIAICKKLPKVEASLGNGAVDTSTRISYVSWVSVNNETLWLYQKITDCINYMNDKFFQYDLTRVEKFQFTHYYGEGNNFYAPHLDCSFEECLPDNRKLSFVLQLSDVNDYEGGELRLHQGKHPETIPKEKGLITFFPSHTLHECTPVTSGIRYTLVGWIHGPKLR